MMRGDEGGEGSGDSARSSHCKAWRRAVGARGGVVQHEEVGPSEHVRCPCPGQPLHGIAGSGTLRAPRPPPACTPLPMQRGPGSGSPAPCTWTPLTVATGTLTQPHSPSQPPTPCPENPKTHFFTTKASFLELSLRSRTWAATSSRKIDSLSSDCTDSVEYLHKVQTCAPVFRKHGRVGGR
jgi:hypothetical protein